MKAKLSIVLRMSIFLLASTQFLIGSPRDVKIGAVNMEGTHKSSLSLATKINHVAPLIAEAGMRNDYEIYWLKSQMTEPSQTPWAEKRFGAAD